MNSEILDIEDFIAASDSDWYDSDSTTIIAPPPSLADDGEMAIFDVDDSDEAEETSNVHSDPNSLAPMPVEDPHINKPYSPIACFFLLEAEMQSIQKDIQELLVCLEKLIQMEMSSTASGSKTTCKTFFIPGSNSLNWPQFTPFIDDVINDLLKLRDLNKRTNEVIRRIRTISKIDDSLLNICAHTKPGEDVMEAIVLDEEVPEKLTVDSFVQVFMHEENEDDMEVGDF